MGCGASKEDIAEPRSIQSHGRNKQLHLKKKEEAASSKPNDIACAALDGSECICALYNYNTINSPASAETIGNPPSTPPSVFIPTPEESLSSDEDEDEDEDEDDEDLDRSLDLPSKLSTVEEDNASRTTALPALSGESKAAADQELEERVEVLLAADDGELNEECRNEQSEECCALGVLSQSAIFQALLSTGPVSTQKILASGLPASTRVGHVAVISGPQPIRWETPMRKAEIIDLDEERLRNGDESLMLENTPEQQEGLSDQEPADDHGLKLEEDSVASLTEEKRPTRYPMLLEDVNTRMTLSGPEARFGKLPPLSIVPPILVEIPADPFIKAAFPMVIKKDLMEEKAPVVGETEQFEDTISAGQTPPVALESADSPSEDSLEDKRSKSSLVTEHCEDGTPTPATKSSAGSGWRSPHRDFPDPDIENIVLLESSELDGLPLLSMLDCHGIHKDKKDFISPRLQLIPPLN